jgi:hypothetical protein
VTPRCECGSGEYTEEGRCRQCRHFPTLGFQVDDWIEARCAIPDRDQVGEPFVLTDEQWRFLLGFYRLDPHVRYDKRAKRWRLPFTYTRGAQLTRPQKWGKGPFLGAIISAEAAGPVVFDGWDANGKPVGRPQATPVIQISALSEDQTDNVWMALLPMIELGKFEADIPTTGLLRIYLPGGGWVEPVTSAAKSRLGQRVTFLGQDQTESWTKTNGGRALADTQRRNVAGMGGRWLSTCNAWDPAEDSVAQYTAEIEARAGDIYLDDVEPAAGLSIRNKGERRRALKAVYGDSWWVDLDRVDAEIAALLPRDPAQAERWFLNRKQAVESAVFDPDLLAERAVEPYLPPSGARIVLGIDGARFEDALAVVGCEVSTGYQWPIGVWERPEAASDDYEHPQDEVDGAVSEAFERYDVWRAYCDPQYIDSLVEKWQGRFGDKRMIEWRTNRPRQIAYALRAYQDSLVAGEVKLADDPIFLRHLKQARRQKLNVYDDQHRQLHTLSKDRPDSPRKIDAAMAAVLAWEARGDCIAAGATEPTHYRHAGFH